MLNSGAALSLITNSDVRYDGILHEVNMENNTISLNNVRVIGTEGRRSHNPLQEIAESDQVYEYIVFRAADIKDLKVKESKPIPAIVDPAIVAIPKYPLKGKESVSNQPNYVMPQSKIEEPSRPDEPSRTEKYFNSDGTVQSAENRKPARQFELPRDRSYQKPSNTNVKIYDQKNPPHYQSAENYNRQHQYNGERRHHQRGIIVPKKDFDIQQSNALFDKDSIAEELLPGASIAPDIPISITAAYNKQSSFFDMLTLDNSESSRSVGHGSNHMNKDARTFRKEEANLNMETFGKAYAHSYRGGRGRGRAGYHGSSNRGGHGYYRGSGRSYTVAAERTT